MTFTTLNGALIIEDGNRLVASTTTHTLEKNGDNIRLTFNAYDFEFTSQDIDFWDLVKMLPG